MRSVRKIELAIENDGIHNRKTYSSRLEFVKGAPMLKLYVDAMIRLNHSTQAVSRRASALKNEDGFVSAETIALAVAGVLIVGIVFGIFKEQITGAVEDMFDGLNNPGGNTPPASP